MQVVSMLNGMYTKFDKCLEMHDVYKVVIILIKKINVKLSLFFFENSKVETIGMLDYILKYFFNFLLKWNFSKRGRIHGCERIARKK